MSKSCTRLKTQTYLGNVSFFKLCLGGDTVKISGQLW